MKQSIEQEIMDFNSMSGSELIEFISWKEEYPREAELAFTEFCSRYERSLLQKAEIYCSKYGYSEVDALLVATCTFARVWKYPTFDITKSKAKNVDNAIVIWMIRILYTQIVLLGKKNTCAEPTQEEDLCIATNIEELLTIRVGDDLESKKELRLILEVIESALQGLSEKHKIIYLTYKAYEESGKNIPRAVSKKLRDQLDLTQNSIGVYKMEAVQYVKNYLNRLNGNK